MSEGSIDPFDFPTIMNHWLMKSELDVYPYSQLVEDGWTHWDGVRNYQARNMMRDAMKVGDLVLFYHSNTKPPHVAGVARVIKEGYGDFTSWDASSNYYDEKSTAENPRWFMVDIKLVEIFEEPIGLETLRGMKKLEKMELLRKGSRLSVQPVRKNEFDAIRKYAHSK